MNKETLATDLLPFTDIGTAAPKISERAGSFIAQFSRDGRLFKVTISADTGKVDLKKEGFPQKGFSSFAAMLASDDFASLRRWADAQSELLRAEQGSKRMLPVNAKTHQQIRLEGAEQINALLGQGQRLSDSTEVLLIDGPAGIGKTHLVEQLAYLRASSYRSKPQALVLHVRSRGRVLSNLQDLMAFSLQTLRSNTTYDQVPVLLKHGLIIVAVDGFDELGDPNGYELAWSQVNELITAARGNGTILLSGRDTFLGRDRLFRDVQALRQGHDIVIGLTLQATTPEQANAWLRRVGWTDVHFQVPAVTALLEADSFALRPMFLRLMAENLLPKKLREEEESFLTPLLVKHMLQREAGLFGRHVESVIPKDALENFLLRFLIEVARDMADNQTEALDDTTLAWLVDISLAEDVPDEVTRLIRNRAGVIAALCPDIRPGYKAFVHSHLQNYFLALATVQAVAGGELPKFLRRNVFGSEFIAVFGDVAAKAAEAPQLQSFIARAGATATLYSGADRAGRNLAGLIFSILALTPKGQELTDCEIDETVFRGTAEHSTLRRVSIHQLDCRGADLSKVVFEACSVENIIANEATRLSPTFPSPRQIVLDTGGEIIGSTNIELWLTSHGRNSTAIIATGLATAALKQNPIYGLLGRACRVRQYWLRLGDDNQADKILRDENWQRLADALRSCRLLREETRQASGTSSTFTHIRMREKILFEDSSEPDVRELYENLNALIG